MKTKQQIEKENEMLKYYQQLEAGKIVFIGIRELFTSPHSSKPQLWPYFTVEMPNGKRHDVMVGQDDKPSGPGSLLID
tara:strand:- start:890 stop:1123 length:234 start_codon:yes stop_codon:yes gene_type:complete